MILFNPKSALSLLFIIGLLFSGCEDSTSPGENASTEFDHTQAPGTSVDAFLNDSRFKNLEVEVDYMPGHQPTSGALDSLATFFSRRLIKPTITINEPTQIPSGQQQAYTSGDLLDLESQHRDQFTQAGSNVLHAYILVVDGSYAEVPIVLGTAYYNTSIALFGSSITNIGAGPRLPSKLLIEASVMRHSFGHVWGLVGNGTPAISDHETGGTHCTVDGCLMSTPGGTSLFYRFIFNGVIPRLDPLCLQDLRAVGGNQ
jgi:hypothetical protein